MLTHLLGQAAAASTLRSAAVRITVPWRGVRPWRAAAAGTRSTAAVRTSTPRPPGPTVWAAAVTPSPTAAVPTARRWRRDPTRRVRRPETGQEGKESRDLTRRVRKAESTGFCRWILENSVAQEIN